MLSQVNFWSYLSKNSSKNEKEKIDENIENKEQNLNEKEISDNSEKIQHWGHYFLEVGKNATNIAAKQVSSTAKQIRQNVSDIGIIEQTNIISKFSEEQIKFKEEKRLVEKRRKETCLPWMDALNDMNSEDQVLKSKILSVSSDERNFLRNPPSGNEFEFNYELQSSVALLLLKEDENLAIMRYNLVPKKIKEEFFWRNYFFRVFLIKQSLQTDFTLKDHSVETESHEGVKMCHMKESENHDEFVSSETGSKSELSTEQISQLKKEIKKAGNMDTVDGKNVNDDWEAELQKELSEFELVNEDNGGLVEEDKGDYDDLEREILDELEK